TFPKRHPEFLFPRLPGRGPFEPTRECPRRQSVEPGKVRHSISTDRWLAANPTPRLRHRIFATPRTTDRRLARPVSLRRPSPGLREPHRSLPAGTAPGLD